MMRKDCETNRPATARPLSGERGRTCGVGILTGLLLLCVCVDARAGAVRLWPTAVVVADTIRLDDVCVLRGFDADSESQLARTIITESPAPGGSRIVHLEMIRAALAAQRVNLADVTLSGALRCAVTRPNVVESIPTQNADGKTIKLLAARSSPTEYRVGLSKRPGGSDDILPQRLTLRAAVIEHFNAELGRYHGEAELSFDRTDEQVLNLSGPGYAFRVRTRGDARLGLVPVEVGVMLRDRIVQTVPLVVQVSMLRSTVVARRAINQDAAIQPTDVETISLRYSVLNRLGIDDPQRVIGQRARRLIRAGATIELDMLERVPLVVRGQLVSVASVSGGVRVVTSGKASGVGHLGDVVTVHPTDRRSVAFDAIVVGPGQVQMGGRLPQTSLADSSGGDKS